MDKLDIKSLNLQELTDFLVGFHEKPYRAKQIYSWIHEKLVAGFDDMTNIPKALRMKLEDQCILTTLEPLEILKSKIDGTEKYLFQLNDGNNIESVLMRYKHGNSVCISTQAGCRMGCKFCASALNGLKRNLHVSEMLDQIYRIQYITSERISHIVLMGVGEPLDNYEHVIRFIKQISFENGLHISQRNITISTCGLVPYMRKLAREGLQITLALSLHASDDETRKRLMPVANQYSIAETIEACEYYFKKTGRRITFEYSLVAGVNDQAADAYRLSALIKDMNCHVNLIPVNPIKERDFKQSVQTDIERFKEILDNSGIHCTVRRETGRDINGSCGQLRVGYEICANK